jgi:hypothetical protein
MRYKTILIILVVGLITSCQNTTQEETASGVTLQKKQVLAQEALDYCKTHNLNTEIYFLIDFSKHSGLPRFYVWDFEAKAPQKSYLVSHGCYTSPWGRDQSKTNAIMSNVPESHASSEGKYIVGDRGYSNWGINVKYWLRGQDATNNNAKKRVIVLHGWEKVSDEAVYPRGTPEGWGCPAVSNKAMRELDAILQNTDKNVLLWVVR